MKRKLKVFQIVLVSLFLLFLIFLFKPANYTKDYEVKDVKVSETYNAQDKYYYFTFTYNDITLDYLIENSFKQHRGFVTDIDIIEDDDDFCLIPKTSKLNINPLCYSGNTSIHFTKVKDELKDEIPSTYFKEIDSLEEEYEDIKIYNRDYTYLLWNYNGFYYINNEETKKIDIFDKEFYNITLAGYTKDYLVIADYDSNYTFNKFYTILLKDGTLKEHKLDRDIYFDSYILGYQKNKLYLVDNKESLMYEFNAKKGKLEKIKGQVLNRDKWEDVSLKKLTSEKYSFTYKTNYHYSLEDNKLYLNYEGYDYKTLISDDVTSLVRIKNNLVFYLKTDELYVFNPTYGETILLNNFEWNFNYDHMIYID